MTVIAARARAGRVTVAADWAVTGGMGSPAGTLSHSAPKITRRPTGTRGKPGPDVLLAGAGSARTLALAFTALKIPNPARLDLDEWAQTVAVELGTLCHDAKPPLLTDAGEENGPDGLGGLLLGYAGRIWLVDVQYAAAVPDGVPAALGAGGMLALGYLYAVPDAVPDPAACELAVRTACELADGCALLGRDPLVLTLGD